MYIYCLNKQLVGCLMVKLVVLEMYDQYLAWTLKDMVLSESPWMNTSDCEEIMYERLRVYFKQSLLMLKNTLSIF